MRRKPIKTEGQAKYNPLRKIIRKALDDTNVLEWSEDLEIYQAACDQWVRLNKIFTKLGGFV